MKGVEITKALGATQELYIIKHPDGWIDVKYESMYSVPDNKPSAGERVSILYHQPWTLEWSIRILTQNGGTAVPIVWDSKEGVVSPERKELSVGDLDARTVTCLQELPENIKSAIKKFLKGF